VQNQPRWIPVVSLTATHSNKSRDSREKQDFELSPLYE